MGNSRIALLLGFATCLACAAGPNAEAQQVNDSSRLQLEFIDGKTAKASIGVPRKIKWTGERQVDDPATDDLAKEDKDNNIAEKCGTFPPPSPSQHPEELALPLLIPIAIEVINWAIQEVTTQVVNYIGAKLDAAVKAYTRTWNTKTQTDFYAHFVNDKPNTVDGRYVFTLFNPTKPAVFCLHYTRYKDTPRLASDFLATVAYDPTKPDLVTIRPLRIFYSDYNSLAAKQESDNVAVKIDLDADVTYLGRQQISIAKGVINGTVLAAQFDKNKLHDTKDHIYVLYKETVPGLTAPLPPWALEWKTEGEETGSENAVPQDEHVSWPKHNQFAATLSVSEAGSVPALLKDAADWFGKNKSGVTKEFTSLLQSFASSVDKLKSSAASTGATH